MKLGMLFFVFFLAIVTGFVALNWSAIVADTTLNLGFATVEAPLGLILLGVAFALFVPLLVYSEMVQRKSLQAAAENSKKLHAQRHLAERAEASRYNHLREFLAEEFRVNADREAQFQKEVMKRLEMIRSDAHAIAARREFEVERHSTKAEHDEKTA
jgi:hypothetical protein